MDEIQAGELQPGNESFDTRSGFHAALKAAFAQAAQEGSRELWLCDRDFADWPLGESAVVETLRQWADARRKLVLLAGTYDEFTRRHTRWLDWRLHWSHIVDCRMVDEQDTPVMPCILLSPNLVAVRRLDEFSSYRGRVYREGTDLARCREIIDAIAQRSEPAFPATTLGL